MDLAGSAEMSTRQTNEVEVSMDLAALGEIVERFAGKKIVMFGDFVADEFQFGDISRVSREAPVLILRHRGTRVVPGGGANAANNLAALGAQVFPVTVVGEDNAGDALTEHFNSIGTDTSGIVRARNWATPTKTRFLAGWTHTVAQQVLRVDREPGGPPPHKDSAKVLARLRGKLRAADGMAISDYGFGVASPEAVKQVAKKVGKKHSVTLDARYRLEAYASSGVTAATPNEAELEALHHTTIARDTGKLEKCARATLKKMALESLLVTRGSHGMVLFERTAKKSTQIPVHGSNEAVDVTGAGDTVLAAYTLALASGASPLEAAQIANIAGGLVVMKRGTAVVTRAERLAAIRAEISGGAS
jgi:D-glycero-beta-D-manno-heptose-7-phosphate kinase